MRKWFLAALLLLELLESLCWSDVERGLLLVLRLLLRLLLLRWLPRLGWGGGIGTSGGERIDRVWVVVLAAGGIWQEWERRTARGGALRLLRLVMLCR